MNINQILNTDSYKLSHWPQYPDGTEFVYSYGGSRGGKYAEVVMFALQIYNKAYLTHPISQTDIVAAEAFAKAHGEPFNKEGWLNLLKKHKGFLPVEIRAIPEGTPVPAGMPLFTVVNTDPEFFWITSYIETAILRAVWYGSTVATQSREIKKVIKQYLEKTGDVAGLMFKLHDFGARGVSSYESAGIGGAAHLVNFMGSDTITGIQFAMQYYGPYEVMGYSIPAAEHSTQTIKGPIGEQAQQERMLDKFGGTYPLIAVVSDSYNIYESVKRWATILRQKVIDSKSCVVVRPDSGKPSEVVLKVLETFEQYLPEGDVYVNDKGYKVLPNFFRVIQGDGINYDSINEILQVITAAGWSADNLAFGMGGGLLQQIDRDTLKFAMKASAACINGEWVDVYKDPITDKGKSSLKGRVTTYTDGKGNFKVGTIDEPIEGYVDAMETVFLNGKVVKEYTFPEVRANAEIG